MDKTQIYIMISNSNNNNNNDSNKVIKKNTVNINPK